MPLSLHAKIKRLTVLAAFTVTLVVLGDLLCLKPNNTLQPVITSSDGHSAPHYLKPATKYTRTLHMLLLETQEHEFTTEKRHHSPERHKLTSGGLVVDTARHPRPTTPAITQTTVSPDVSLPFRYIINEPHLCANISNLYIINFICTAPQDYENRTSIRKMWGNNIWTKSTGFKTVFLVGESADPRVMASVREESSTHHDIIQFSFLDSYNNLTLKVLSGLHWIENFCSSPVWVLKSDTDLLVNIFSLNRYGKNLVYYESFCRR